GPGLSLLQIAGPKWLSSGFAIGRQLRVYSGRTRPREARHARGVPVGGSHRLEQLLRYTSHYSNKLRTKGQQTQTKQACTVLREQEQLFHNVPSRVASSVS